MEIDKRYKTTSIGIYNRNVFECPECGTCILNDYYKHICGIAEVPIGTVSIKECPTCFRSTTLIYQKRNMVCFYIA